MTAEATITDDAAGFGPDVEELALFGDGEPDNPEAEQPPARKPGRPGPAPNPNSKRQQRLTAARTRARTATAPAAWQAGAEALIGQGSRLFAVAGFALGIAAAGERNPVRAATLQRHAQGFSLDSLTIAVHGQGLADGAVAAAENLPWLARVLENAAKIGPYAAALESLTLITLQGLVNHGFMPAVASLGTMEPDELAAAAGVPMDGPPAE